jgi:hypothetical protein
MTTKLRSTLLLIAAVVAMLPAIPSLHAEVPHLLTVQGRLNVDGTDFSGTGHFKFALVDGGTEVVLWSNAAIDAVTEQPEEAVELTVQAGLYSVALGDSDLPNMATIEVGQLNHADVRLRIWFSADGVEFHRLSPDQRLTAVAYAMLAAQVADEAVGTDQIADEAITGDKLDPRIRYRGRLTVDDLAVTRLVTGSLEAESGLVSELASSSVRIGSRAPAEAPLHVQTRVEPGTAPENHVAIFHNTTRAPNANGIAIMLGTDPELGFVDKSNNYISFYDPAERVVGRVEGFSIRDFQEALRLISVETLWGKVLGGGFYNFDFRINPTEDWFDPGALPLFDFDPGRLPTLSLDKGRLPSATFDPGQLPDLELTGYIAPKLGVSNGESPSLSFSDGEAPSLSFSRGSLPSLNINFLAGTFSWSPGTRPTASFDPGEAPTATLDPGKLPTVSLDPGQPPSISGSRGRLPSLTFDPGVFPEVSYNQGVLPTLEVTPGQLPSVNDLPFTIEADFTVNAEAIAEFIAKFEGDLGELRQAWCLLADPVCAEMMRQAVLVAGAGVTYESGSGDYAEWLPRREAAEDLAFGDIVGVHGGEVTKDTADADQLLVVSYKPIVLGNMPPEGARDQHEMVAFMGQVPVKVDGIVQRGDFILTSGRGDGRGRAVSPEDLQPGDLAQCVGVAWDASDFPGRKLVRVAIGLQPRVLSEMLRDQHGRVENLEAELDATRTTLEATQQQLAELTRQVEQLSMAVAAPKAVASARQGVRPASFERERP